MRSVITAAAGIALSAFTLSGAAQSYPAKPVRFIVPYAPGGGTDIVARIIGQKLSDAWGLPVVIDNRPGAGSTVGTALAVRAPADGYTLVMSSISLAFDTTIYKDLPYDPVRDLAPVGLVASQPNILAVHPSLGVKSVSELLAHAKARPGAINYASGGNGSGPHLATELLKMLAGINITHVSYKGTGPALNDLLGGQVQMMIAVMASTLPHVASGKLRGLAVTGAARSPSAPDIPTIAESGVPNYEFNTWYGIQVPAGTPVAVVNQLNAEVLRVVRSPDVRARFAAGGLEPRAGTPDEFGALVRSEIAKWSKVAATIGAAK
jgi:tripartite-type tricarboxylate transporter receptor subunit TctC